MKKLILLVFVFINLVGCNQVNLPSADPGYVQAQGKITVNKEEYLMLISEFEWKEPDFEAKKIGGPDLYSLAENFETMDVEKDEKLNIEIEQNPASINVVQWNEDGTSETIKLNENQITLPKEEGYYVYEVKAKWNEGEITYIFDINLKNP